MGKTLKTVGMVLGAAAMIATGVGALAMPGLAGSVTLFGVSTGTLNLASAGLTAVGGLLDKPQSAGSGSPTDWTSNPDQPTPFAFGRVGVAGKVIHRDEYGKDNKLQGIVSVFSGAGPIRGFVSYRADDLSVSFESNGGTAIGKYRRQMWRSWRMGAQPDTALSLPTGLDEGAVMPGWGSAYRLSGKACDLLTVQQDSKFSVYPSGVPTPTVELDGIFGYDPRYDDTYPGGAGPCRLGVRSTYVWIDNPIIAGLNWALGMVENGQVVGGIGASIQGIDVPAFVEAANVADANDWKVTAWPDTSEDASQVLRQFLQAGGASYARHAGKISCVTRGAARPSIVTITARDTCGPLELDTGSSSFNRLNTITPEFMSAAHGWKHVPTDPVTYASLRAEDGGKKSDRIQYRFVPAAKQAGQLAAYDILDAREPFSGTIPLKPHLRRLKRGDCFTLSEPGFLLDGVKFIVLGRTYDAQKGEVRLAFRSETDGKHDLALGKTTTMPEYPGLTPAEPTSVSPPGPDDWVIVPRPPGPGGTLVPGFDLSGIVGNSTATAIEVQWWEVPDDAEPMDPPPDGAKWESAGTWPPTANDIPINVQGDRYYWIGLIYVRGQNYSERTVLGPYLSENLIAGGLSDDARKKVVDELKKDVKDLIDDLDKSEDVAELVLETILNEQEALEAEAHERLKADTGVLQEARTYTDDLKSQVDLTFYTRAQTDAGMASTLQYAQAYTDDVKSESMLLFSTKAERASGDALSVIQAKAYTDDYKSEASLVFATQAALGEGLAETLNTSQSYTNGHVASAMDTVYTKAQVNDAVATTLQEAKSYTDEESSEASLLYSTKAETEAAKSVTLQDAKSYTDDVKAEADLTYATQSSLGGVNATAGLALSTAQDASTKLNEARVRMIAEASGSDPAVFELYSGTGAASFVRLAAAQILFGNNTVLDDATDQLRTITNGVRRVSAWGASFGADGTLTEWEGPDSVAEGAMSRANAFYYRANVAPYFGGSALPGQGFHAQADFAVRVGTRTTAGLVTTSAVTIATSGATGTVTYAWSQIGGNDEWTIVTPSGATTTFRVNVATPGEIKRAQFACLVTDTGSGRSFTIIVGGAAIYNV